jgi:hypothetical protein
MRSCSRRAFGCHDRDPARCEVAVIGMCRHDRKEEGAILFPRKYKNLLVYSGGLGRGAAVYIAFVM